MTVGIEDIRAAAAAIEGEVVRTPLIAAPRLSQSLGCEISLKLENLQFTGSFKDRGALVKLKSLPPSRPRPASSPCRPATTPRASPTTPSAWGSPRPSSCRSSRPSRKVERTRSFGARVVLTGDTLDASAVAAREIAGRGRT